MKITDQQLAKQLLLRKELDGKRPPFSKSQKIVYAVWGTLLFVAIILQNIDSDNRITCFLFGLVLASIGREIAWYKGIRLTWPFNEKVINWDKVRALSENNKSEHVVGGNGG